jgi:hypothetical protein
MMCLSSTVAQLSTLDPESDLESGKGNPNSVVKQVCTQKKITSEQFHVPQCAPQEQAALVTQANIIQPGHNDKTRFRLVRVETALNAHIYTSRCLADPQALTNH